MSSANILSTYERYTAMVRVARKDRSLTTPELVEELKQEIARIQARCQQKQIELANNKSPYPGREARRAATECIMVIERIIRELHEEGK